MTALPPSHSCPSCGTPTDRLEPWLEIPLDVKTGKPVATGSLVWCRNCDLGMMRRLPSDDEIAESYDLGAYYTHGRSHFPTVPEGIADRIRVKFAYLRDHGRQIGAADLLNEAMGARQILDIGCGSGALLSTLVGTGRSLSGIEPDPQARAVAATHGIDLHDGTAEDLPDALKGRSFDLITLTHVLEHCRDPLRALGNIPSLLGKDGVFYCEVPNCGSVYFQSLAQVSEMLDVPRHIHFFTAASLSRLCDQAGLRITSWRYHGYTRHFGAAWRAWENRIGQMLLDKGTIRDVPRRNALSDYRLLLQSAFVSADRKYDCIGFYARAA